jgi:TRAP-type mannitol/chloroaromatic compound transport system substrate-binding protein
MEEEQMRKKILLVIIGLTLVLTMLFGLLPACGGGAVTTGGVTPGAGGATPGAGGVAPVAEGQKFHWRYQTNTVSGTSTYWLMQEVVANIAIASGGRMVWDDFPQGAIVGMMEAFDAVSTGAIEVANS